MFAAVQFAETFADQVKSGPGAWNHLDAMQIGNNRSYFAYDEHGRYNPSYFDHAEHSPSSAVDAIACPTLKTKAACVAGHCTWTSEKCVSPGPPFAGTPMTEAQEHTIFSLYAMVKTPLMIGADPISLSGHSLTTYLNSEVIAVNQVQYTHSTTIH